MKPKFPQLALAALAAVLVLGGPSAAPPAAQAREAGVVSRPRNPIFPAADPHIAAAQGRWWIYPTTPDDAPRTKQPSLFAYVSDDLRTWKRTDPIFSFEGVDWIDDDGARVHYLWAPALAEAGGRFYLYYSVGPQNPTPSRIGVAVADSPAGPFKDSGKPLLTGGNGFEAIDPMVFVDPKTAVPYLYAGGSAGAKLRVFELEPSMTEIKREIPVEQPPYFTEGPFMHERNGIYYLSYSHGRWNFSEYTALYATAPGPVGPWTVRGVLLKSDNRRKGPGHHSIARNPATGEWFIAYHRWELNGNGPYEGERQIAVQPLVHNPDGTIEEVRMNNDVPPASPIPPR